LVYKNFEHIFADSHFKNFKSIDAWLTCRLPWIMFETNWIWHATEVFTSWTNAFG